MQPEPGAVTEDHWTVPSAWCLRPDQWHADTDDATEYEVTELVAAFVRALQPDTVVETGTNTGQTARAIAAALHSNGHGHLWTLEIDETFAADARNLLNGLPATVITGNSLDYDPPATIDFAWIDSGPASGATGTPLDALRRNEISRWLPNFTPGAVIGIHDTAPHHPTMQALRPLFEAHRIQFLNLRTPRGVCFAQIPA